MGEIPSTMFWQREGGSPWHQGGTAISSLATAEEAVKAAGMLRVSKLPLYVPDGKGGMRLVHTHRMITNEAGLDLAICSPDRGLVQPIELFELLQPMVDRNEAAWETGGVMRNGKTIWCQVKMLKTEPFEVVPGDVVGQYCLGTLSYDGKAIWGRFCDTRAVCENTILAALSEKRHREVEADGSDELEMERANAVRIVHSANVHARLEQAQRILGISQEARDRQAFLYKAFARARMNSAALSAYFERVIPDDENIEDNSKRERARDELMIAAEVGRGTDIKGVRGTLWGAWNAVTEWCDHGRGSIGGRDPEARALPDPTARLQNIFLGSGARIKNRATRVAVELVGVR